MKKLGIIFKTYSRLQKAVYHVAYRYKREVTKQKRMKEAIRLLEQNLKLGMK